MFPYSPCMLWVYNSWLCAHSLYTLLILFLLHESTLEEGIESVWYQSNEVDLEEMKEIVGKQRQHLT